MDCTTLGFALWDGKSHLNIIKKMWNANSLPHFVFQWKKNLYFCASVPHQHALTSLGSGRCLKIFLNSAILRMPAVTTHTHTIHTKHRKADQMKEGVRHWLWLNSQLLLVHSGNWIQKIFARRKIKIHIWFWATLDWSVQMHTLRT